VTTKQVVGRVCIVWLAPGVERLVPVAATSLVRPAGPPAVCRLAAPAVQALLAVLASAEILPLSRSDEEDPHATDDLLPATPAASRTSSARAAAQSAAGHRAAPRLGKPLPGGTDPDSPGAGAGATGGEPCP
jgi:hypothetical protein